MDGFKSLEELQEEERIRDEKARNTFIQDVTGFQSGVKTSFGNGTIIDEIGNMDAFQEMDMFTSTLIDQAYEKDPNGLVNSYGDEVKPYIIQNQEKHQEFMQKVSDAKTIMNDYLNKVGVTRNERTLMDVMYGKYADRIVKGYPDNYISYKTPLGENYKSIMAAMNNNLSNHKLQKDIDKWRQVFPVYGYLQQNNKIYDTLINYWEEKKANPEPVPEEKEQEYREKLYNNIISTTVLFDKMMSAIEDPVIVKELHKDQVLGNDPFHLHPLSARGMGQVSASLESYKKCLENGWAIDDIAFVAGFKYVIDSVEKEVHGNQAVSYDSYKKFDPPKYVNEEAKKHIEGMKALYEKIAENPLRSAEQRKEWLDQMDQMVKEGMEKNYLKASDSSILNVSTRYYQQLSKQRPLRDKLIEAGKEKAVFPSIDTQKAMEKQNKFEMKVFNQNFAAMESLLNTRRTDWWFGSENKEHKNLREAVETLKRFYAANPNKVEWRTPEEQELYARKLLNRLDAVEHYAKLYLEKKSGAGTEAGKDRVRGAERFKNFARLQKQALLNDMKQRNADASYATVDSMRSRLAFSAAEESVKRLEEYNELPTQGPQRERVISLAANVLVGRIATDGGIKAKSVLAEHGCLDLKKEVVRNKDFINLMDRYLNTPGMTGKKFVEEITGRNILKHLGTVKTDLEARNQQLGETRTASEVKKVNTVPIMGR